MVMRWRTLPHTDGSVKNRVLLDVQLAAPASRLGLPLATVATAQSLSLYGQRRIIRPLANYL